MGLALVLALSGCVTTGTGRYQASYLCKEPAGRDDRLVRLSYERSPLFLTRRCASYPDLTHDTVGDALSMSTRRSFQAGHTYMQSAALRLRINGNLVGSALEEALPPEEFARFYQNTLLYHGQPRPSDEQWVERAGFMCVRFYHWFRNPMQKQQEVDYWCWEGISGVQEPFNVSALEAVGPNEEWKHDLDRDILNPFFASLRIKHVPPEVLTRIERQRQEACLRHKKHFDENGKGWIKADFPDNRRALRLLKSCGYDVEVPPHDGQVLRPGMNNRSLQAK